MPGLGKITKEHTVWCSRCEEWYQGSEKLKSFVSYIKQGGWKLIKELWVCPKCVSKSS